jgi:hypothetical protein
MTWLVVGSLLLTLGITVFALTRGPARQGDRKPPGSKDGR